MITDIVLNNTYPTTQIKPQSAIMEKYIPEKSKSAITINYSINNNELPKETNNRQYCNFPVLNQGNQNGCLPYAIVNMIQYYQCKNLYFSPLSSEALYYWIREAEGVQNQNAPTYPQDALNIAQIKGIPEERFDSNIPENEFIQPSNEAIKSAILCRIDGWKSLDFSQNKSDIIAKELVNGDVVMLSFFENQEFINPNENGIVDVDKNKIDETKTHSIMVVDYKTLDDGHKLFLCLNSWGKYYGIQLEGTQSGGWIWLTDDYVERYSYFGATIQLGKLQSIINSVSNN
jgi:hypothetical protein